jgi:hypothetical protein
MLPTSIAMVRAFPSAFLRVILLISAVALLMGPAELLSAPLLHPLGTDIHPQGRIRSMATDGTNVVAAVQFPSSGLVGAMFIPANDIPLERFTGRQSGSAPYVAFNGTNYLLAWTESPGDSAELHGQFIDSSFNLIGPQTILMAGLSAQKLAGLSWDGHTFLAVWAGVSNGLSLFQGQLFFPDGGPVGPILQISSPGLNATNCATSGATNHFVVWMESNGPTNEWHTRSRFVSADGSLSEILTLDSTPAMSANPVAASFGGTNVMAVWSREVGPFPSQLCCSPPCPWTTNYWLMLFGRMIGPDGSLRGDEFQISNMRGNQIEPQAGFTGTNYIVAWTDSRLDPLSCATNHMVITIGQQVSVDGALVDTEFWASGWYTSAGALVFGGNRIVYAVHYYHPYQFAYPGWVFRPIDFESLNFVVPRHSGTFRNFVFNSNGFSQVEFVRAPGFAPFTFRLQLSTNLADWRRVPLDYDPAYSVALKPNEVTKWVDPLTNYSGPRFYRGFDSTDTCVSNLTLLEHVKAVWAFEHDKNTITGNPTDGDLFGPGKYLPTKPICPLGGTYWPNDMGSRPSCTLGSSAAHSL